MRHMMIALLILLVVPLSVGAADGRSLEFGIRGGTDATGVGENYSVGEVYLSKQVPWRLPVRGLDQLALRLEAAAAQLKAAGDEGVWLAAGGALVYRAFGDRLELEAGWRPTWLPDYQFGKDNFGGQMQFSSHVGVGYVWRQIHWSYRFQHTSNAGLYDHNPGLDLHMLGVGFRF